MSMNLYVESNGCPFDLWQTPTKVTFACLESSDPKECYIDWVMSLKMEKDIPVYDDADLAMQWSLYDNFRQVKPNKPRPVPVSYYSIADAHIEELENWLNSNDNIEWSFI